jgi:hypothetical protein
MGRVARYKKLKSCDPFAKNGGIMTNMWGEGNNGQHAKKRSLTSQKMRSKRKRGAFSEQQESDAGFDLPPSGRDDFDIHDLVGSLKKEKPEEILKEDAVENQAKRLKVEVAAGPQQALSLEKETREAKVLKINLEKKKEPLVAPRMEGESKKAFYKRMQTETKRAIRNEKIEETSNPEKKQKKKEFLKLKKQKKKKGGNIADGELNRSGYGRDDEYDGLVTGERAVAQKVAFGDQVERPPTFQVLPRGATAKKSNSSGKSNNGMSNAQQHAEQRSMEKMREMVQARYALIKAQRKQGIKGNF